MTVTSTQTSYDLASKSFNRCSQSDDFFGTFYATLKGSDPAIEAMFAETDFSKQNELLRVAIDLMLMFERKGEAARQALAKIRESHNHNGLNIRPELYDVWIDSLMQACRRYDQEFSSEIEAAWREVLKPSLAYIKSGYHEGIGERECLSYLRSIDPQLEFVARVWLQLPTSDRKTIFEKASNKTR